MTDNSKMMVSFKRANPFSFMRKNVDASDITHVDVSYSNKSAKASVGTRQDYASFAINTKNISVDGEKVQGAFYGNENNPRCVVRELVCSVSNDRAWKGRANYMLALNADPRFVEAKIMKRGSRQVFVSLQNMNFIDVKADTVHFNKSGRATYHIKGMSARNDMNELGMTEVVDSKNRRFLINPGNVVKTKEDSLFHRAARSLLSKIGIERPEMKRLCFANGQTLRITQASYQRARVKAAYGILPEDLGGNADRRNNQLKTAIRDVSWATRQSRVLEYVR